MEMQWLMWTFIICALPGWLLMWGLVIEKFKILFGKFFEGFLGEDKPETDKLVIRSTDGKRIIRWGLNKKNCEV